MKREISRDLGGARLGRNSLFIEDYNYSLRNAALSYGIILENLKTLCTIKCCMGGSPGDASEEPVT